ncbi:WcaI family glycosyltransferase [Siphonobacter sp. SORGH_AS_1065]|uniref:WcaI family glycosyltransferase n=1 Tax=Siphonobacter sp. SORGH_AS_1065 TaxID=3041795 RepID=UPI00278A470E|nr:WcaI family glycosyltransferase [Siphonobacter sp. SORGH_AS_1065]MDQ1085597.1 colanic acid biosynthesis glycosyl transferase WcaI [Siphonobacter sp. SORGH_AS_1065]
MNVLIYGINYTPELTGIGKYTGDLGSWLAQQGHQVTVVTAMPYYPEWKINKHYKGKFWHSETINGVKVFRVPLYVPKKITSIKRIIHEGSFALSSIPILTKLLFKPSFDIVIHVSPPFHLGIPAFILAKIKGSKFLTHVQDLQIDMAKDLKLIKSEFLLNSMFKLEGYILRKSNAVSTITSGMASKLLNKGISCNKIILYPNSVDTHVIKPISKEHSLRNFFGIDINNKVILYSGNIGEKQNLDHIVKVAHSFINQPEVLFVVVGSGVSKDHLTSLAANAPNIRFFPLQPYDKLAQLLAIADIHLVLQKGSTSDLIMPSKLGSIFAAGGCAIVAANSCSFLYQVVHEFNMGILIEPDSIEALYEGIVYALTNDLSVFSSNARSYAEEHLDSAKVLGQFEEHLSELVSGKCIPLSLDGVVEGFDSHSQPY